METSTASVAITAGGSFLIGGLAGVITRNYLKILAFILGAEIAFITYLQHLKLININWDNIDVIVDTTLEFITTLSVPDDAPEGAFTSAGVLLGGLVIGFIIGFKYG